MKIVLVLLICCLAFMTVDAKVKRSLPKPRPHIVQRFKPSQDRLVMMQPI